MRLTSIARRSVALAAATALVSGGLATALAAPAHAAAGTITGFTPTEWDNRSTVTMTITGTGFNQPALKNLIVLFTPTQKDLPNEVDTFTVDADPGNTSTTITAKVPLAMAPPGLYQVRVADNDGGNESQPAPALFKVYGFGSANATGVAFGPDPSGSAIDCALVTSCLSRAIAGRFPLDITGSNIAIGAKVRFLTGTGSTPDPGLSFVQNNPNNSENAIGTQDADSRDGTGYASATLLQGNYGYAADVSGGPGFTPGLHKLQIVNTDGLTSGQTVDFVQPWFAAPSNTFKPLSPSGVGDGAKDIVVTLTGQGIRSGSTMAIESGASGSCGGVTTGPSTVFGDDPAHPGTFTHISAPVSVAECNANDSPRAVTIVGPEGARFARSGVLNIVTSPTFGGITSGYEVLGQGARVGYAPEVVTITGTGFQADPTDDPDKMTKFSFGDGVTVTTLHVLSGSAQVTIDVDDSAPVGDRVATVTNPDGGSSSKAAGDPPFGDPAPMTIEAGPKVSTISPRSLSPSAPGQNITITGSFDSADSYVVKVCNDVATATTCTESPNITEGSVTDSATALTFAISTNGATAGLRDVLISDTTDHGRLYCNQCMSVDTLTVSPTTAQNSGDTTLTFSNAPGIEAVTPANATATLTRTIPIAGQNPIVVKAGTLTGGSANTASGTFPLAGVVPGKYSVLVTKDPTGTPTTWSCSNCFTVTGPPFTLTGIDRVPTDGTADTTTSGGQGVTDLDLKITGTNFTPGMDVSIPDVTTHDVNVVSATVLTLKVDIASNAAPGSKPVSVKAVDGSGPSSGALTFVVTAAPTATGGLTPAVLGQGAGTANYVAANDNAPITITIHGENFVTGTQLSLGPDTDVTDEVVTQGKADECFVPGVNVPPGCGPLPDTLTGKVAIGQAAALGNRNAVISNPDGGAVTVVGAFTVNQGPKVTSVANADGVPVLVPDGVAHPITVLGSGFATGGDATKVLDVIPSTGVTITNVVVVDAGKITADIKAETSAARGVRVVGVTNQTDKGFGQSGPVYVATKPAAPANLALVPGAGTLTASWSAPNDGGAPITGYHVTIQRVGSSTVVSRNLTGSQRTTTFGGLVNGATYVVKVTAANVVGVSPVATRTGIPGLTTTLSGATSLRTVTAGSGVTISGRLMHGSIPVPGRTVRLTIAPYVGASFVRTATTNSSGVFAYRYYPRYHFAVRPYFPGDGTYRSAVGPLLRVAVPARVTRTSPSNGSRSSHLTTLTIRGNVFPSHPGTYVYLYRYTSSGKTQMGKVKLSSTSTFTFSLKPGRGTYTFRVYIPGTTGNSANYSSAFTLYRT